MDIEKEAQERIINSYEVKYMVKTLLMAERNHHLTPVGTVLGLLKVAAQIAGDRDMFLAMAAEISEMDPEMLCDCAGCALARAAARDRLERNWDLKVPPEFPATVGNA